MAIIRDITERKKAEDAIRTNEALLSNICAITKIGGWQMDLLTREAFWAKRARL
jgi:hypothetical protein